MLRDEKVVQASADLEQLAAISVPDYWSRFSGALWPYTPGNVLVGEQPKQFAGFYEGLIAEFQQTAEDLLADARGLSVSDVEHDVIVRMSPLRQRVVRIHPTHLGKAKPRPIHDYSDD
jgi:hypothetical protein